MRFLATCDPGLEEIAIQEVFELTRNKAEIHHKGAIVFEGEEEDIFTLNYFSRSINRILILLEEFEFQDLKDIYRKIKAIDFSSLIYPTQTFAIRAERFGTHNFTSLDVAREAGQAVIDSYLESKNHRLKVNLKKPNITIRVEVRENKFFVGLDTTGEESLHKRWYRKFSSKAPLKSTIAYAMIKIAELKREESMIDPFCGCGTIPIEAFLYLNNIPPNQHRSFDFVKFFFLDRSKFFEVIEKARKNERKNGLKIFGSDIKKSEIEKAIKNAEIARVKINFFQGDATKIELNYDKIIADLPFGIRTERKNLKETYQGFFDNLKNYDWKKVVFITASEHLLPSLEISKSYEVEYGDLKAKIFVLTKK